MVKFIKDSMEMRVWHRDKPNWPYRFYMVVFFLSCFVNYVFCFVLYSVWVKRDVEELKDGNVVQTRSVNISFIVVNGFLFFLLVVELVALFLFLLAVTCCRSFCQFRYHVLAQPTLSLYDLQVERSLFFLMSNKA